MTVATDRDPGRLRGVTDIAPRVVERIAGKVAAEVPDVFPPPSTGLGRLVGATAHIPRVTASIGDDTVALEIDVAMHYPAPLSATSANLRAILERRVRELTGMAVTSVAINVVDFVSRVRPHQRVE